MSGTRLTRPNPLPGSNGVAFGPDGRLYVAQFLAGRISAVDLGSGDVEIVVPEGGPVQSPDDLAFGADGSMYITDLVPGRVWRRDPGGEFQLVTEELRLPNGITCVGDRLFVNEMRPGGRVVELTGGTVRVLADGLAMGNAMQLGPDGCLYYPHMLTGQVFRVPLDGGAPELVAEEVHEPVAVRFDRGGVLHVLSRGAAGIVTRIDGSGDRSLLTSGVVGLDNAAFDAENRMFVSSYASGGLAELHPDGRIRQVVEPGFGGPYGVTVDLGGRVHAGDHYRLASPDPSGGVRTDELLIFTHGVVADGELLHLTSQYGQVSTYDPATGESRLRANGLARPMGIAVRADGALVVAEADAGRVVAIDSADEVSVLAEGLDHPVDVALDPSDRVYFSDDHRGGVFRIEDGDAVPIATELGAPQGLAVRGDEVFTVETTHGRLRAISLSTGESRIEATDLAVAPPPAEPRALFADGMPGAPIPFAGLAVGPDGAVYLAAEGIVRFQV
ncbi:SMP-30/gluconolactonase/LRE family protein [Amycolatopsis sp. 195334CR]|uniref:SMP-30/gluconolactonase/LRE family protein n=1 Tax=Amycolatopsis sp. 195334CR TaxID=2814588 RepID=UPI001A8C785A|nr:PQQ-binding-like beta-propeller repeat protein [Amycolatopsis sp. 195334CR]MBN6037662.1 SMP-30/gluconolactonase/LRE family protein [Amycolatopsis sp. 195334CR]